MGAVQAQVPDSTQRVAAGTGRVELIFADKITGTPTERRLSGSVQLKQKDTQLWANEVVQFLQKGEIELSGNVRIKQGNDSLFADFIRYNENTKIADASGNIRFTNGTNTVFAPSGRYFVDEKKVEYQNGARILDDGATLSSQSGTYLTESRVGNFTGGVQFQEGGTQVTANSGIYRADEKRTFFEGNVRFSKENAIVFADKGMYDEGQQYADFEGNVRFNAKGVQLFADKGHYNEATQIADFEGNVRYQKDNQSLSAQSGQYFEAENRATFVGDVHYSDGKIKIKSNETEVWQDEERSFFRGNVVLEDEELILKTPQLQYLGKDKRASFENGVIVEDADGTLTAERGNYALEQKVARFFGKVCLNRKDLYLEADSLSNFNANKQRFAYGNVYARQSPNNNPQEVRQIWAGQLQKDDLNGITTLQRQPIILQTENQNTQIDSLWLSGERIEVREEGQKQILLINKSSRIYRKDFSALSDSLHFIKQDSTEYLALFGDVVAWQQKLQLSGTEMHLYRSRNITDSLRIQAAWIAEEDSTLKTYRQLKAKSGFATFLNNKIDKLLLNPQAELLDFIGKDGKLDKAIRATSDRMQFKFIDESLSEMDAVGNVNGQVYDAPIIPPDFNLTGFRWRISEKPVPEAFLDKIQPRLANRPQKK